MSVMSLAIFSSTVHVLLICQHRSFQITPTIFRRSIEQSFKKLSFLSCSSSTVYISSRMDWSKPLYSTVQCAACWMDLGRLPWLKGLRNTGLSAVCVCVSAGCTRQLQSVSVVYQARKHGVSQVGRIRVSHCVSRRNWFCCRCYASWS